MYMLVVRTKWAPRQRTRDAGGVEAARSVPPRRPLPSCSPSGCPPGALLSAGSHVSAPAVCTPSLREFKQARLLNWKLLINSTTYELTVFQLIKSMIKLYFMDLKVLDQVFFPAVGEDLSPFASIHSFARVGRTVIVPSIMMIRGKTQPPELENLEKHISISQGFF